MAEYEDALGRRIDAWDTADLQVTWAPTAPWLGDIRLLATVRNLFDTDPPFYDSPTGLGFDSGQANQLGRVASLQLIKRW